MDKISEKEIAKGFDKLQGNTRAAELDKEKGKQIARKRTI